MKVVFYTINYKKGGLDTFLVHLLNNWPNKRDELILICNGTHPGLDTIKKGLYREVSILTISTHFYDSRGNGFFSYFYKLHTYISRIFYFFLSIWNTRVILKKLNPSRFMVVNGGYPAADACRAASIAWATINGRKGGWHNFHNYAIKSHFPYKIFENLVDFMIKKSVQGWITVSNGCALSMCNRPLLRSISIEVVPNGIEKLSSNFNLNIKDELNIPEKDLIILMLGVYEKRKGHEFLIRAFKIIYESIDNIQLVICGHGTEEEITYVEHLKEIIIPNISKRVHLLGFRNNTGDLLRESNVLVVPSQRFESFGLTSVEAMSMSIPVVATTVGGITEVVKNGDGGYTFERNDLHGFSKCIIRLLKDRDMASIQGAKGYRRFNKKFKASKMARQYFKIME